jgi:hypothetical protein
MLSCDYASRHRYTRKATDKVPHILDLSIRSATYRNSSHHSLDGRNYKYGYEEKNLPLPGIKAQPSRSQLVASYIGPNRKHIICPYLMFNYSSNLKFNLSRTECDSLQALTKFHGGGGHGGWDS